MKHTQIRVTRDKRKGALLLALFMFLPFLGADQEDVKGAGATQAGKCIKVSSNMTAVIQDGFKDKNIKLVKSTVYAVKSKDYKNIYFIAAKTGEGEVGVWSSNSLVPGKGILMAAESYSVELSVWPDGRKSKAKLSMFDNGFSDALRCSQKVGEIK